MTAVKSFRSPKTEVSESSRIRGRGLFARELIKKGEIIAIKSGHLIDLEAYKKLDEKFKRYCLQIEDNFFLGPKKEEEIEENVLFFNHSCQPNVGFDGQTCVALRDINPDEELCHDYAMCFTVMAYSLDCKCGSQNCRGKITQDGWQLKELQEKYGNHFAWFILKKIKSNK